MAEQLKLKPILQNGELLKDFLLDLASGESEGEKGKNKPVAVISICNAKVAAGENLKQLLASIVNKLTKLEGMEELECSFDMDFGFPEGYVLAIDKWFQVGSMEVLVLVVPSTPAGAEGLVHNGLTMGDKNMLFAMLIASSVCIVMSEGDFHTHANLQLTNFVNLEQSVKVIRGMGDLSQEQEMIDISAPVVNFFVCDSASNTPFGKLGGAKMIALLKELLPIDIRSKVKLRAFVEPPADVLRLVAECGGEEVPYFQTFTKDFIEEVEIKEFQRGTTISREEFPAAAERVCRLIAGFAPRAASTVRVMEPFHQQSGTSAPPQLPTSSPVKSAMDTLKQRVGPILGKMIFDTFSSQIVGAHITDLEKKLPASSNNSTSSQNQGSGIGDPGRPHSPVPSTSQGSGTSSPRKQKSLKSFLPSALMSALSGLGVAEELSDTGAGPQLEEASDDSNLFPTIWAQIILLRGRIGDEQFDILRCLREAPNGKAWLDFQAYLSQRPRALVDITLDYRSDTPFLGNLGTEPAPYSKSGRGRRMIPYNRNTRKVRRRTFSMDACGFLGVLGYLFPTSAEEEDEEDEAKRP